MEEDREGVEGGTKREWERREWRAEVGGVGGMEKRWRLCRLEGGGGGVESALRKRGGMEREGEGERVSYEQYRSQPQLLRDQYRKEIICFPRQIHHGMLLTSCEKSVERQI